MENINIGTANLLISNKLKESYLNNDLVEESKEIVSKFLNIIKESPILQLEFKVFNNLENKSIQNDLIATRYIDNNIKLFEIYTVDEINKEHEKISNLINEADSTTLIDNYNRKKLYESIGCLIEESLLDYDHVDVDKIHESFEYVLNHIKKHKQNNFESSDEFINEEIIEIAVDKFNDKYSSLNEDDKNLLQKLIKSDYKQKTEIFENMKYNTINILESFNKEGTNEKVDKSIKRINEMNNAHESINENIIDLHELHKSLNNLNI